MSEIRVAPSLYDIWERDCIVEDEDDSTVDEIYELFLQFRNEPTLFEHITGLTLQ
jgi:hypothetical protein